VPAALGDPRPPPSFPENGSLDVSSLDNRQTLNRPRPHFVPLNDDAIEPREINLGASNVYRERPLSLRSLAKQEKFPFAHDIQSTKVHPCVNQS
jgi:hypothetical protein